MKERKRKKEEERKRTEQARKKKKMDNDSSSDEEEEEQEDGDNNSSGDEPKKFSIFDEPKFDINNPIYFSMYDKVRGNFVLDYYYYSKFFIVLRIRIRKHQNYLAGSGSDP